MYWLPFPGRCRCAWLRKTWSAILQSPKLKSEPILIHILTLPRKPATWWRMFLLSRPVRCHCRWEPGLDIEVGPVKLGSWLCSAGSDCSWSGCAHQPFTTDSWWYWMQWTQYLSVGSNWISFYLSLRCTCNPWLVTSTASRVGKISIHRLLAGLQYSLYIGDARFSECRIHVRNKTIQIYTTD